MPADAPMSAFEDEMLTVEEHDSTEEYLEALYMLEQSGVELAPISQVAEALGIKPPSAVQMLKRMADDGLVEYIERQGVRPTETGRRIGQRMVRNGRLMEVFMTKTLDMPLDVKLAHAVEHDLTDAFADALCTLMGHPAECPHGYVIPAGDCCPTRD